MSSDFEKGKQVKVFPYAKIIHKGHNLTMGDYSQVDDFVFINAGEFCEIGRFTHIASFSSIVGGGRFVLEDFAGLSAGVRIITGSDDFSGGFLSNPTVPEEFKNVITGKVVIKKHAIVGTNAIILPNVTIGEGASVGAGSLVKKDLEPWGIYVGSPARKIGLRDRKGVLEKEEQLLAKIGKERQ